MHLEILLVKSTDDGGDIISHYSGPSNLHTGQLDRRTLLHKRYIIQRTIGRGGMGAVYLAKDMKRQGAICAIKEMSLSMVPPEEQAQAIQNFKIEARILWGLNHPNLPAFTGFFSENQRYFLVMEYIDGMTLEEMLERSNAPFSERRVLGWARQLCDVLEYLHSQNPPIIFRDMKPGNIMLTRTGHIKLIDFGIARFFRPSSAQDTQHLGTPGFAPPEQYGGAQTDVRSDVYSLGMALFQLLTNTLSENVFGAKDVRAINPQISPVVARALEKATAYEPADRYNSVAELRAALLGVGFVFDNGDLATTPQELAELCARYPEEASDYLAAGEIEAWLHEIGESKLARETQRIRTLSDEPQDAVESFLQVVLGQNARLRSRPTTQSPDKDQTEAVKGSSLRLGLGWLKPRRPTPVLVSPRTLDFGQVYPGISAPLSITINGDQGLLVSGKVYSTESWIMLDQAQFDGMSTRVNVRVNSTKLQGSTRYSGTITISPDSEGATKDILVTVEAEIQGAQSGNSWHKWQRGGKTNNADLNDDDYDEEDYDVLTLGGTMIGSQLVSTSTGKQQVPSSIGRVAAISTVQAQDSSNKAKYGQPATNSANVGWDPLQVSARQRLWMQQGFTFSAAFMVASLLYTFIGQFSVAAPQSPNLWFIAVLASMVPAATLGALVSNWKASWPLKDTLERTCTGMASTLLGLVLIRLLWQIMHLGDLPAWQLVGMLLVASVSATIGITPWASNYMLDGIHWVLVHFSKRAIMAGMGIIGAGLGYLLTVGFALNWFTLIAIVVGAGVALALVWCVDSSMKQNYP